jgi:hypothetical protein
MTQSSLRRLPIVPEDLGRNGSATRSVARMLASVALGRRLREDPEEIVSKTWPSDVQAELLTRAAVAPTSTTDVIALTPTMTGAFLHALAPQSAASRLFEHCLKLDFTSAHQFLIPYPSLLPVPIFIGEGQPMPMVQAALGSAIVGPTRKILLGSAVSNELEFCSPENASVVIGRILSDHTARNFDHYVFDDVAADENRPAGLLNGVTPLPPTAGGGSNAMTKDVANIVAAVAAAGGNADSVVFIASAAQATTLRMLSGPNFTNPVLSTSGIADGTIIGVDPLAIATGFAGLPTVETAHHATAHFEDTNPQPLSTPGAPNVVAAPTRSGWQTNTLFLKIRMQATWATLMPGTVQVMEHVTW